MNSFLKEIEETKINSKIKGIPFLKSKSVKKIKLEKLNIIKENIQFPILSIDKLQLIKNIRIMKNFAVKNNLSLAPHCKTFMSPQLINNHLKKTWGLTISNNQQLSTIINLNVKNIIYGNLIVNEANLIQYLDIVKKYRKLTNIYYCIDSLFGLNLLIKVVTKKKYKFKIRILIELGTKNGRCGIRNFKSFKKIVISLNNIPKNILVSGLFFYEGAIKNSSLSKVSKKIMDLLQFTFRCHEELVYQNLYKEKIKLISGGGSEYFDLVTKYFNKFNTKNDTKLILRPGSFIAYGHGYYEKKINNLKKRNIIKSVSDKNKFFFKPSLLLWSHVLSINDNGIAIVNFGKRDVSFDLGNPIPINVYRNNKKYRNNETKPNNLNVFKLNDQHAFLKYNNKIRLNIGDLISFGISHPCITLDKWKYVFLINSKFDVIDVYQTFF